MYFLPSQSVNDLRYDLSSGAAMTYIETTYGPGSPVDGLSNTPSAAVWS